MTMATTLMDKVTLYRLRELARAFRTLIALVGIAWVCLAIGGSAARENPIAGLSTLGALGVGFMVAVYGHRVATLLELPVPPLWAVGLFIPILNLILLLALSRSATTACRRKGVRVGLFGPDAVDLLRIERAIEAAEATLAAQAAQAAHAAQAAPPR
ncbi:MAG TPA: hypothetical protein VFK02_03550 [Kofleriaceae bacterium]|nr:hypothetical protein [Kofleriaceae bacterium]